jgi:hypothetical protein
MNTKTEYLLTALALGVGLTLILMWLVGGRMALVNAAPAAELRVCLDGCTYSTIQAAVDAANNGDVIKVAAGIYTGIYQRDAVTQVVYISKSITIQGGYTVTDWMNPSPTVYTTTIDAQGLGRVIYITGDVSPTIEGLYITGGDASGMGGSAWGDAGGGVYVVGAAPIIRENAVFSNTASTGGGLWFQDSPGAVISNTIVDNRAIQLHGGGVGLHLSDAMVAGNTFTANVASAEGGGLYVYDSQIGIYDNTFVNNECSEEGGGLLIVQSQGVTVSYNVFFSNTAAAGGGLMLASGDGIVEENLIVDNEATHSGGGLYLNYTPFPYAPTVVDGNTVISNRAGNWGGGLAVTSFGNTTLSNNLILSNTADADGAMWLFEGDVTLVNNVIADNRASVDQNGVSIYGATVRFVHNTLARNGAEGGAGVLVTNAYEKPATTWFTNTIVVSHSVGIRVTGDSTATLEATLWGMDEWANDTDYEGPGKVITGTMDIRGYPDFGNPEGGDYHIGCQSDGIEGGVETGDITDIDGEPRLGLPDIGADEFIRYQFLPSLLTSASEVNKDSCGA